MTKKILPAFIVLLFVSFSSLGQAMKKTQSYDEDKHSFKVHEHVMVTMPDGKEVIAVIHGHVTKKKYYVRQYRSRRQGKVHEKYIRHMTESEMADFNAKREARKKKK